MTRSPLVICFWILTASIGMAAEPRPSEAGAIGRVAEILALPPSEAGKNHAVSLEAVVTCALPASQLLFIADESGGIFVMPTPWPAKLAFGDRVRVTGRTANGRFAPIIQTAHLEIIGQNGSVTPRKIALEELAFGRYDGQWIEVSGVVRRDARKPNFAELEIAQGSSSAKVLLFEQAPLASYVDSRLRLRGVAGTFYHEAKLTGFGIFLPGTNTIELLEPPPADPFAAPLRTAQRLFWYSPAGDPERRVRVSGTLTHVSGKEGYVRDETGSVPFVAEEPIVANPGVRIELVGFLDGSPEPHRLIDAKYRILGGGELPPARRLDHHRDWAALEKELVEVDGIVAAMVSEGGQNTYVISGANLVATLVAPSSTQLAEGSRIRARGILEGYAEKNDSLFPTILASPGGIDVLAPPAPRAGPAQSQRNLAAGVSLAVAGFAFALWQVGARRRHTAKLGKERSGIESQLQDLRGQLDHSQHERERLGRDLHDHTIQSIYALGLRIDECAATVEQQPAQVKSRLSGALQDVNRIIRELRNVIMGLESSLIRPQEFRTALKSLSLALGVERSSAIRLDLEQAGIDRLTPAEATELVHLTREALSNTIRHAEAQSATVRLYLQDGLLRFSVEDDGKGFDTTQPTRPEGLGLRNMARRAERLGARFTVASSPGHGTKIVLDIPRPLAHGS